MTLHSKFKFSAVSSVALAALVAGSLPAAMNAVSDALRSAGVPAGTLPLPMPATPERVWRALRRNTS